MQMVASPFKKRSAAFTQDQYFLIALNFILHYVLSQVACKYVARRISILSRESGSIIGGNNVALAWLRPTQSGSHHRLLAKAKESPSHNGEAIVLVPHAIKIIKASLWFIISPVAEVSYLANNGLECLLVAQCNAFPK
jgi:hypothetical protein